MRKKTLNYDGAEFTIAPLTLNQAEELLAPIPATMPTEEAGQVAQDRAIKVICKSLNRASGLAEDNVGFWNPAKCGDELDSFLKSRLFEDILAFSGYQTVVASGTTAGETTAATKI